MKYLLAIKDAYQAGDSVLWIARDLCLSVDMVARVVAQYGAEWDIERYGPDAAEILYDVYDEPDEAQEWQPDEAQEWHDFDPDC